MNFFVASTKVWVIDPTYSRAGTIAAAVFFLSRLFFATRYPETGFIVQKSLLWFVYTWLNDSIVLNVVASPRSLITAADTTISNAVVWSIGKISVLFHVWCWMVRHTSLSSNVVLHWIKCVACYIILLVAGMRTRAERDIRRQYRSFDDGELMCVMTSISLFQS